jgi:hypothetical protein
MHTAQAAVAASARQQMDVVSYTSMIHTVMHRLLLRHTAMGYVLLHATVRAAVVSLFHAPAVSHLVWCGP